MATQTQPLRGIAGRGSRDQDPFWNRPAKVSNLRLLVTGDQHSVATTANVHGLLDRICAWLTRPTEFEELRQADAVQRLLAPTGPGRCVDCQRPDWLNKDGRCPACRLLLGYNMIVIDRSSSVWQTRKARKGATR